MDSASYSIRKSASLSSQVVSTNHNVSKLRSDNPRHSLPPGGIEASGDEKSLVEPFEVNKKFTGLVAMRDKKYAVVLLLVAVLSVAIAVPLAFLSSDKPSVTRQGPEITETQLLMQLQADFAYLEDCQSYDLDFCSTASKDVQPYENSRMSLRYRIWWFEDTVKIQAKQQREGDDIFWYVRTTINFAHDPLHDLRSKVYVAKITTNHTVLQWKTYELVNGYGAFRCNDKEASEWSAFETRLVESMLVKTPLLLLGGPPEGSNSSEFEDEDAERNGTFGMVFDLSELSESLNASDLASLANATDNVFAQIPNAVGPSYLYENITVSDGNATDMEWEDENFFNVDCKNWFDLAWNDTLDLSEEVPERSALKIQPDLSIATIDGNTTTASGRRLDFVPAGSDNWESWQNIETPIPFLVINPSDILPYMGPDESLTQDFFDEYLPVLLQGDGLPNTKQVIEELRKLREWVQKYLDLFESTDYNFGSLLDVLITIQTTDTTLQVSDAQIETFILFMKSLQQIPQLRPYVKPVLFHLEKIHQLIVHPAMEKVKEVQKLIRSSNVKSFVKQLLIGNEELAEIFLITALMDNNLIIPPLDLMKNCKNVDRLSASILSSNTIQNTNNALKQPWELLKQLNVTLPTPRKLKELEDLIKKFLEALDLIMEFIRLFKPLLDPFEKILSRKITLPVIGPFCQKTMPEVCIGVPCGTKYCKKRYWCGSSCKCSWRGCKCKNHYCTGSYACGVKYCRECTPSYKVTIPCARTFSYSIRQLLKGVNGILGIILRPMRAEMNRILSAIPKPDLGFLPAIPVDIVPPLLDLPAIFGQFKFFAGKLFEIMDIIPSLDILNCGTSDKSPAVIRQMVSYVNGTILQSLVGELLSCPFWDALNVVCEDDLNFMFCNRGLCSGPTPFPTTMPSASPIVPTASPTTKCHEDSLFVDSTTTLDEVFGSLCPGCRATFPVLTFNITSAKETGEPFFEVTVPNDVMVNCKVGAGDRFVLLSYGNGNYYHVRSSETQTFLNASTAYIQLILDEDPDFELELASPVVLALAPRFNIATISGTGKLSAAPFDGSSGGALVIQAGSFFLYGTIDMSETGGRPPEGLMGCPDSFTGIRNCSLGSDGFSEGNCYYSTRSTDGIDGSSLNEPGTAGKGGRGDPHGTASRKMQSPAAARGGTPHYVAPVDPDQARGRLFLGEGGANGAGGTYYFE